jgi:hypothetical protein
MPTGGSNMGEIIEAGLANGSLVLNPETGQVERAPEPPAGGDNRLGEIIEEAIANGDLVVTPEGGVERAPVGGGGAPATAGGGSAGEYNPALADYYERNPDAPGAQEYLGQQTADYSPNLYEYYERNQDAPGAAEYLTDYRQQYQGGDPFEQPSLTPQAPAEAPEAQYSDALYDYYSRKPDAPGSQEYLAKYAQQGGGDPFEPPADGGGNEGMSQAIRDAVERGDIVWNEETGQFDQTQREYTGDDSLPPGNQSQRIGELIQKGLKDGTLIMNPETGEPMLAPEGGAEYDGVGDIINSNPDDPGSWQNYIGNSPNDEFYSAQARQLGGQNRQLMKEQFLAKAIRQGEKEEAPAEDPWAWADPGVGDPVQTYYGGEDGEPGYTWERDALIQPRMTNSQVLEGLYGSGKVNDVDYGILSKHLTENEPGNMSWAGSGWTDPESARRNIMKGQVGTLHPAYSGALNNVANVMFDRSDVVTPEGGGPTAAQGYALPVSWKTGTGA